MLNRIVGSFGAQLIGLALSFADRFVVAGLLIRALGDATYADWVVLVSAAGLLTLGEAGLNIYFGNAYQKAQALRDDAGFQRILSTALAVAGLVGLCLFIVAVLFAMSGGVAHLSLRTLGAGDSMIAFLLLAAAVASRVARGGVSQIYRGRQIFAQGLLVDQAPLATTILGTILLVLTKNFAIAPLAALALAADLIFGWGLMLFDLRRRFPDLRFTPSWPTRAERADLIAHVRWLWIAQVGPIALLQAPVLLLGATMAHTASIVGFVILRTLVNFARQIVTMMSNAFAVELADAAHKGDAHYVAGHVEALAQIAAALGALAALGLVLFGPSFVVLWTGAQTYFDPVLVGWLLAGMIVAITTAPLLSAATLSGLSKAVGATSMTQLVVGVVALLALGAVYGARGAAIGLAIGDIVAFGVVAPVLVARRMAIAPVRLAGACLRAIVIALVVAVPGTLLALWIGVSARPLAFIAVVALWLAVAAAPAMMLAAPARYRQRLKSIGAGAFFRV